MTTRSTSRRGALRAALAVLLFALPLASCRSRVPAVDESAQLGTFYTQFTLRLDRGLYRSTNYRSAPGSTTLPINTQVELLSQRRNVVTARVVNGGEFRFEHVAKHTQDTMQEALDDVFGPEPVDLSGYSDEFREAIERGEVAIGMDKATVLVAIGPPPASLTLSRDLPEWVYAGARFSNFVVRFDDEGKVTYVGR